MKKTGWAILLALCCIGGYLVLPSNYYLRRALIHLLPKIDQYPIFENRTIEAGAQQAWIQSEDYNKLSIPEKYLPVFDELGTVAFVIIKYVDSPYQHLSGPFDAIHADCLILPF